MQLHMEVGQLGIGDVVVEALLLLKAVLFQPLPRFFQILLVQKDVQIAHGAHLRLGVHGPEQASLQRKKRDLQSGKGQPHLLQQPGLGLLLSQAAADGLHSQPKHAGSRVVHQFQSGIGNHHPQLMSLSQPEDFLPIYLLRVQLGGLGLHGTPHQFQKISNHLLIHNLLLPHNALH